MPFSISQGVAGGKANSRPRRAGGAPDSRCRRSAPAYHAVAVGAREEENNVKLHGIPFEATDWAAVAATEHRGEAGVALWRTRQLGDIRVRIVEYSPGYVADHWCEKGHVLLCLDGELRTELKDGRSFVLTPGMSYQVADNEAPHRSSTATGARLFIVD